MPNTKEFPMCCTALNIYGFGESATSPTSDGSSLTEGWLTDTLENAAEGGFGIVIAMTTDEQDEANKLFEKHKFQTSGWISKPRHPETRIKLWWKDVGISEEEYEKLQMCDECDHCGMC